MATIEELRHSDQIIRDSAEALGVALLAVPGYAAPSLTRAVQAEHNLYDRIQAEFGLFTATEVGRGMGSRSSAPRNLASAARSAGRLLAIRRGNNNFYPGFQFDADGQPLPVIEQLHDLAQKHRRSETGIVQWLCAPTTYLSGESQDARRPVDLLVSDPAIVVDVAARAWDIEW
ncbi:hypothetical protein [Nocardioides sp. Iso805N]|uniref:hypothetical protein n=1 Tax=Nocardioides sp. Iso805N TaxID=1283287 RepID=UPI0003714EE0|nr:hypothetical protein [Nocardioides sp. Iso805N]